MKPTLCLKKRNSCWWRLPWVLLCGRFNGILTPAGRGETGGLSRWLDSDFGKPSKLLSFFFTGFCDCLLLGVAFFSPEWRFCEPPALKHACQVIMPHLKRKCIHGVFQGAIRTTSRHLSLFFLFYFPTWRDLDSAVDLLRSHSNPRNTYGLDGRTSTNPLAP